MALIFPRGLPDIDFRPARFELQRFTGFSRSGQRLANMVDYADPRWSIQFESVPLYDDELERLKAWWDSLREMRTVLVSQNVTCRPLAHAAPANAAPAQDSGVVASASGGQVVVNSVSAALVLAPGDMIGFEAGFLRAVARVTDVSGSGTSRTLEVEPVPPAGVAVAGTVVVFENPKLLMRPVPGSYSESGGFMPVVSFRLEESRT